MQQRPSGGHNWIKEQQLGGRREEIRTKGDREIAGEGWGKEQSVGIGTPAIMSQADSSSYWWLSSQLLKHSKSFSDRLVSQGTYLDPIMEALVSIMMTALNGSTDELAYHGCWRGS